MSNGPTGTGSNFRPMQKINVKMSKEHWCTFRGECKQELNITTLCWNCIWMQKYDIPPLVEEELKNANNRRMEL